MLPSRWLLSFLTIVGSLDTGIGFSFCHANNSNNNNQSPRSDQIMTAISSSNALLRQRKKTEAASASSSSSALHVSGGATATTDKQQQEPSYKKKLSILVTSLWGSGGVIYILAKAIKRVLPIAMEPFQKGAVPLSQVQLG
jgi:hypothetical protein